VMKRNLNLQVPSVVKFYFHNIFLLWKKIVYTKKPRQCLSGPCSTVI
jgi:hypothetical protein